MADAQTSSKQGLTRKKAILIGVLSVVLVVILYLQFGRGGEKPVSSASNYRPPRPAVAVQPVSAPTNQVTLASAKTRSNAQPNKTRDASASLLIDGTKWKSPKLETIVAHDPFALPPTFPQPPKMALGAKGKNGESLIAVATENDAKKLAEAVEKLHMELEELKQRGVHVILRDGDQYVAWIGERMLHVGDKINDFTVTAIDTDGVHIERIDSP